MFKSKAKKDKAHKGKEVDIENKEQNEEDMQLSARDLSNDSENLFGEDRKDIRELVAPNGVNPNPLDYFVLNDGGQNVYAMMLYIESMPLNAKFALTFAPLFNYEGVTSKVMINPLSTGRASKMMDHRVVILDSEETAAAKSGDRNRVRKISGKMNDAESWARDIEQGENHLYEVTFLFEIWDTDLEKLRLRVNDFHARASEKGIGICACYSVHPEAFLSMAPLNQIFVPKSGPIRSTTAKKWIMDKYSLACIYNHTSADFSHKGGIIAGRNMHTGQPFTFDIYDPSHNGYGLICSGKTGTGKSATIKMYLSRYIDLLGYQVASVDFESRGNRGEYSLMAERVNGINYQIKNNADNIMNPYEVNVEEEYDETTQTEYKVLRLSEKLTNLKHIMLTMMVDADNEEKPNYEDAKAIKKIISDTNAYLYERKGIRDQDVDSLYTTGNVLVNGRFTSGKVKKKLPTISEFYYEILLRQKRNKNSFHDQAYNLIIDAMSDYVTEMYYCPDCLKTFTREEYEELKAKDERKNGKRPGEGIAYCVHDGKKEEIKVVKGTRAYFDGQSTLTADSNTPHVNIDISQLPDVDKPMAQIISLDFLNENFIKRNSVNPKKTKKMVMLVDELHKTFPYPEARKFISDVYRTARKRHVSPWSATQALKDFAGYKETEAIVKNSTAILLLKQDFQDKEYLLKNTVLTPSQVEEVLSLGGDPNDRGEMEDAHKGEICLICNDKVSFIKVDYLKASEAYIVETEVSKINDLHTYRKEA